MRAANINKRLKNIKTKSNKLKKKKAIAEYNSHQFDEQGSGKTRAKKKNKR